MKSLNFAQLENNSRSAADKELSRSPITKLNFMKNINGYYKFEIVSKFHDTKKYFQTKEFKQLLLTD